MKTIAVEGCVGVGKSTLASALGRVLPAQVILEQFELNPFLGRFYKDPHTYALGTEICFLFLHYYQLMEALQIPECQLIVSDFCLEKDLVFSRLTVPGDQQAPFDHCFDFIARRSRKPDLLVCIRSTDELILTRIAQRNRAIETRATRDYFGRLNQAFEEFFRTYSHPKIEIRADDNDFLRSDCDTVQLAREIKKQLRIMD